METDTGSSDQLDMLQFATQDSYFMGCWVMSYFQETITATNEFIEMTFNRYLPHWQSDKEENWDDDYRWNPESPLMLARLYQRQVTEDNDNKDDKIVTVKWRNLDSFVLMRSALGLSMLPMVSAITIILSNF